MKNDILIGFQREYGGNLLARQFALYAKEYNYNWFKFSAKNINLDKKIINGYYLDHGHWIKKSFPFPDVINNDAYLIRRRLGHDLISNYNIPLVYYRELGGKSKQFEVLNKIPELKQYLLYYKRSPSIEEIIEYLNQNKNCILKPNFGSGGVRVYIIKYLKNLYFVNNDSFKTLKKLLDYYQINLKKCCLQEYCPSYIKEYSVKIPVDVRCHLVRSYDGVWKTAINYIRLNPFSKSVSNLHSGGSKFLLYRFLKRAYGSNYKYILDQIKYIVNFLPDAFNSFYPHKLNTIGIDLGINRYNNHVYIFEINSFPGTTLIEHYVAKWAIQYDYYIGKTNKNNNI